MDEEGLPVMAHIGHHCDHDQLAHADGEQKGVQPHVAHSAADIDEKGRDDRQTGQDEKGSEALILHPGKKSFRFGMLFFHIMAEAMLELAGDQEDDEGAADAPDQGIQGSQPKPVGDGIGGDDDKEWERREKGFQKGKEDPRQRAEGGIMLKDAVNPLDIQRYKILVKVPQPFHVLHPFRGCHKMNLY